MPLLLVVSEQEMLKNHQHTDTSLEIDTRFQPISSILTACLYTRDSPTLLHMHWLDWPLASAVHTLAASSQHSHSWQDYYASSDVAGRTECTDLPA